MNHYSTQEHVGRNSAFLVILGGMLIMLGFITALSPWAAGLPVKLVVGIMLLCRGSMQLYYGVKVRHWGRGIGPYIGMGSIFMSFVSVACGVALFASPMNAFGSAMFMLAAYLVLAGGVDVLHAIELKAVDGWFIIFINGLLAVALGVMVWQQWPLAGAWAIGGMVGLSMILNGAALAGFGASGRSFLIRQKDERLAAQQA